MTPAQRADLDRFFEDQRRRHQRALDQGEQRIYARTPSSALADTKHAADKD